MSDDEYQRRQGPWIAVVAIVAVLCFGLWLRGRVIDDAITFQNFCKATHVGETWEHVQERAAAHEWGFVRQSKQGLPSEEWLCRVEMWSYQAGCVVTVAKGRVIGTRFAELPK